MMAASKFIVMGGRGTCDIITPSVQTEVHSQRNMNRKEKMNITSEAKTIFCYLNIWRAKF